MPPGWALQLGTWLGRPLGRGRQQQQQLPVPPRGLLVTCFLLASASAQCYPLPRPAVQGTGTG
jgi:hypothetical protein